MPEMAKRGIISILWAYKKEKGMTPFGEIMTLIVKEKSLG